MALQPPSPTRQGLGQGRGNRGLKYDIAALEPCSIQRAKPGTGECVPGLLEPSIRLATTGTPRVKEPRQFLDHRPPERRSDLLAKCLFVSQLRAPQVRRDQQPDRPLGKRSQQVGVPLQEEPELHRYG